MSIRPATVKPLGNRILSRLLPPLQTSKVIFVPSLRDAEERGHSAAFAPKPAVVVAVGPGVEDQKTGAFEPIRQPKVGDHVLLPQYPGVAVPEIGVNSETGDLVEIRPSTMSGLMITKVDQIVGIQVTE